MPEPVLEASCTGLVDADVAHDRRLSLQMGEGQCACRPGCSHCTTASTMLRTRLPRRARSL